MIGRMDPRTHRAIPLEIALSIAEVAVTAGLASWCEGDRLVMTSELEGQLSSLGVSNLGQLSVDQAQGVVGFVRRAITAPR